MTTPTPEIPPVDPTWALPDKPSAECSLTGPAFARLLAAGREGGWPGIYHTYAEGRMNPSGKPSRKSTLDRILKRRADLRALLSEAVEEKRERLLSQLETVIERAALGPPDRVVDTRADGTVARVREDSRNRNYAAMWLLERTNPEKYASRKRLEVEGQVQHQHAHAHLVASADSGSGYRVSFDALQTLPEDEQRTLLMLLEKVEAARLEQQRTRTVEGNAERIALPPGQQNGDAQ